MKMLVSFLCLIALSSCAVQDIDREHPMVKAALAGAKVYAKGLAAENPEVAIVLQAIVASLETGQVDPRVPMVINVNLTDRQDEEAIEAFLAPYLQEINQSKDRQKAVDQMTQAIREVLPTNSSK